MCGRYDLHTPRSVIAKTWFQLNRSNPGHHRPRYNIPPATSIEFIREEDNRIEFAEALWGFRPNWAGDDAPRPINARSETVATSRYFAHSFQKQRCLIPANGWFEWLATDHGKQPYYITNPNHTDQDVLFFAGIFTGDRENGFSVAILTEPAAPNLRHIHDRQPVVLDPRCRYGWLKRFIMEREKIKRLARRLDPALLTAWPVTPAMNRPTYDDPSIIDPVE